MASSLGTVALTLCTQVCADDQGPRVSRISEEQTYRTSPNRTMLQTGFWAFAISYAAAVFVAADSNRTGDRYLYLPLVGPWLDLASRGECPPRASCDRESLSNLLIAVDGVFQGIGLLDFGAAFLVGEVRTMEAKANPKRLFAPVQITFRIAPGFTMTQIGGIAVVGKF